MYREKWPMFWILLGHWGKIINGHFDALTTCLKRKQYEHCTLCTDTRQICFSTKIWNTPMCVDYLWVCEQVCVCMCEWMCEWMFEWMCGWMWTNWNEWHCDVVRRSVEGCCTSFLFEPWDLCWILCNNWFLLLLITIIIIIVIVIVVVVVVIIIIIIIIIIVIFLRNLNLEGFTKQRQTLSSQKSTRMYIQFDLLRVKVVHVMFSIPPPF